LIAKTISGQRYDAAQNVDTPTGVRNREKATSALTLFNNVLGTRIAVPQLPSLFSDANSFWKSVGDSMKVAQNIISKEVVPVIHDVKSVTVEKESDAKSLQEFLTRYPLTSSQRVGEKAEQHIALLRQMYSQDETNIIRSTEHDLVHGSVSRINKASLRRKIQSTINEVAKLSANSLIAHGDSFTVLRPQLWDPVMSEFGVRVYHEIVQNQTTRTGDAPAASLHAHYLNSATWPNAASVQSGSANVSPNGWMFATSASAGDGQGHTTFPPKEDCYVWSAETGFEIKVQTGGPTLQTHFGGLKGTLHLHTGLQSSGLSQHYKYPLEWNTTMTYLWVETIIKIPFSSSSKGIVEMYLETPVAAPITFEVYLRTDGIRGEPKSDTCTRNRIDWRPDSSSNRSFVRAGDRWMDYFGRVHRNIHDDPNFSLASMWNQRTAIGTVMLSELIDAYIEHGAKTFGTQDGAPSVNDKYKAHGLTGIRDMVRVNSYIYTDGPLVGKSKEVISRLLAMFLMDLEHAADSLIGNDESLMTLARHNLFAFDTCLPPI
jgi:hypothetical protein